MEAILSQTPGVQSAKLTQDGALTQGTLQLEGEDPREALFFAFAQAGLPLVDFHLDETSLEQIFLGLTQEQPQAPGKPSRLRWRRGRRSRWLWFPWTRERRYPMKAIYKRELAAYAHSMTGCVATAFLLAVVGLYFMAYNLYQGTPGFATALNAASFLLILVIPLLTMRSLAEERKNRTDQLLLTAPCPSPAWCWGSSPLWPPCLPCLVCSSSLSSGSEDRPAAAAEWSTSSRTTPPSWPSSSWGVCSSPSACSSPP